MQFIRFLFYIILFVILASAGCSNSKEIQTIANTETKPEVIVETKAAIVGGLDALQKELEHPQKAKKEGVEAVLKADVLVNKNSKVEQISFDKETEYGFEKAAKNALHKVQFRAGERNGKPINMYITIPVKFEL